MQEKARSYIFIYIRWAVWGRVFEIVVGCMDFTFVQFAWDCLVWMAEVFEKCKLDYFRCWKWWCFAEDPHVQTVKLTFSYYFLSHLIPKSCHRVTYWIIMAEVFAKCKLDCFRCWKRWCFAEDPHVQTVELTFSYYFLFHLIPTLCHKATYWIIMRHILQSMFLLA